MPECRDCFHRFLCSILENKGYQQDCRQFVDRSLFVVLPCKVGDEIFCTTMGKIHQGIVGRIELDDEGIAIITTDGYCFDSSICYHMQKEAEQSLKERKKMNDHFADVSKKDTMSLTLALIALDRLNTSERIDVARDNLVEAVRVVSAEAKYRIAQKPKPDLFYYGYGKCPTCGVIFADKSTNYCGNCGQSLDWS